MNEDRGRYLPDDRAVLVSLNERMYSIESYFRRLEADLDSLREEAKKLREADQAQWEPIYRLHAAFHQGVGFVRILGSVVALGTGAYTFIKLVGWI